MLYIKLFIEREKSTGQSAPECPFNVTHLYVHQPTHGHSGYRRLDSNKSSFLTEEDMLGFKFP